MRGGGGGGGRAGSAPGIESSNSMKRFLKSSLIVLAAVAGLVAYSLVTRPHERVAWRSDFESATAEARRTGKPMLVDFTASWCGPCQDMRRTTWSDRAVAQALGSYVPVQVDVDAHPDLAQRFHAEALPHLAVLDPWGNVINWFEGEMPPDAFLEWLRSIRTGGPSVSPTPILFAR